MNGILAFRPSLAPVAVSFSSSNGASASMGDAEPTDQGANRFRSGRVKFRVGVGLGLVTLPRRQYWQYREMSFVPAFEPSSALNSLDCQSDPLATHDREFGERSTV